MSECIICKCGIDFNSYSCPHSLYDVAVYMNREHECQIDALCKQLEIAEKALDDIYAHENNLTKAALVRIAVAAKQEIEKANKEGIR